MPDRDEFYMRLALKKARQGMERGQAPFGACIVKDGSILACEHNQVWVNCDITAHAEVIAIREACDKLGTIDLSGCVLYATTEPCPMCFSAIHWAKISHIFFGTRIADAHDLGFSELGIPNEKMKEMGPSPVRITGDFLAAECRELLAEFEGREDRRVY